MLWSVSNAYVLSLFILSSKWMMHTLKTSNWSFKALATMATLWISAKETLKKFQWLRSGKASFEMPLKIGKIRTIAVCAGYSNRKHNTEVVRWKIQFDFYALSYFINEFFLYIFILINTSTLHEFDDYFAEEYFFILFFHFRKSWTF